MKVTSRDGKVYLTMPDQREYELTPKQAANLSGDLFRAGLSAAIMSGGPLQ